MVFSKGWDISMGNWVKYGGLGILCSAIKGQSLTSAQMEDGDVPVIAGGMSYCGMHNKSNKKENTISISASGANAGYVMFHKQKIFATDCSTIESSKWYEVNYIYYYLHNMQEKIYQLQSGLAQPHIYPKDIANIVLNIPESLSEQEKIAEILSTVDIAIDKTKAIVKKYKNIKKGLLQDLLTNGIDENGNIRSPETHEYKDSPLGKIPVEWECVTLDEFVCSKSNAIVAGPFGSDLKVSDYRKEGVPILRLQNVGSDVFINKDIMFISDAKAKQLKRHSYSSGDIVLAKLGIPIGKTSIVPSDFENGIVVADVVRIKQNFQIYNKYFLMFQLNSDIGRRQLNSERIGTTRPRVNISQLKKTCIKKPGITEQNSIGSYIFEIHNKIIQETNYTLKLEAIKKGLMQDLLTNTVSVDCLL